MKTRAQTFCLVAVLYLLNSCLTAHAQGTAFTYQGRLNDGGSPANGNYDLSFSLFPVASGGSSAAGPLTNTVAVSNGLFTVQLDFGSAVFNGASYWLQIAVRTNGNGAFTALTTRQQLTPSPYAIFASSAAAAATLNGTLPSGSLAGTYNGPVIFNNPADSFTGNGTGLTNVNAALLDGLGASNFWQTAGNSGTSPNNGNFIGTTDNQPLEARVNNRRVLRLEPTTNDAPNIIGGARANLVLPGVVGATISGGGTTNDNGPMETNFIAASFASISGGSGHTINTNADHAAIAGGKNNLIDAGSSASAIVGGAQNSIFQNTDHSFIGGGYFNIIIPFFGSYDSILGGENNSIGGAFVNDSVISGGNGNQVQNSQATVGGGISNLSSNTGSTVGGGAHNTASGLYSTVAGGGTEVSPAISAEAIPNATLTMGNTASGDYSSVGGGNLNQASGNASAVAGGYQNLAGGANTSVGGGNGNQADGDNSTVGGGSQNIAFGAADTLSGGINNSSGGGNVSTISGGAQNNSSGSYVAIGGGAYNSAGATYSTISGGASNTVTADYATISGGYSNTVSGQTAFVAGGELNVAAADRTFAGGSDAQANHQGAFVWADYSTNTAVIGTVLLPFASSNRNEFAVRATGGVRLVTAVNTTSGAVVSGVALAPGGTSWATISDRNAKKDFAPVNSDVILDKLAKVPVEQWHYKWEDSQATPNIGPMAQDFIQAFYPGRNDTRITTLEFDGVELAAIQALNEKLKAKDAEIEELKSRLEKIEKMVQKEESSQ